MEDKRTFKELLQPLSATVDPRPKQYSGSGRDMPASTLNTMKLSRSPKLTPKRAKRGS